MDHLRFMVNIYISSPYSGGDVTGSYGATTVNTLGGGAISVSQLVTLNGAQFLQNKQLSALNTYFVSDTDPTRIIRYGLGPASPNTTLTIQSATTANRTIIFPDASDTLVGKNTIDVLKNKTLTDVSNTVYANGIRNGATWTTTFSGAAPAINQILRFDGVNSVWADPSLLVTLAGDVTGPANNNVATKASGDFSVAGYLTPAKTIRVGGGKNKSITFYDNGDINSDADRRFSGIGNSGASMIYNLGHYISSHIFRVADSATTYRDLIAFVQTRLYRTDYPIYMGDAMEIKKLLIQMRAGIKRPS